MNLPVAETSPKIITLDEAEAAGAIVAGLDLEIKAKEVQKGKLQMAAQRHGKQISELQTRRDKHALRLKDWCKENPEVMQGKESLELRHVTLSFKWGNYGVCLLENWTDAMALKAMRVKNRLKKFCEFIRVKHEIDRQSILRDSKADEPTLSKKALAAVGLEIDRERFFYCESKLS